MFQPAIAPLQQFIVSIKRILTYYNTYQHVFEVAKLCFYRVWSTRLAFCFRSFLQPRWRKMLSPSWLMYR